ncbi:hypothetical protein D0Y65_025890 [Glycine soja]|uniref:Uncharacterized protein n=1 Tax=Glycine soja TaxID=3848 RepID=A0A445IHF3_GLYSO|nr:hypothetical protein D0Y65_025890 [Glycine soja]
MKARLRKERAFYREEKRNRARWLTKPNHRNGRRRGKSRRKKKKIMFRGELDRVLKASKDHVEGIATKAHQIPQHLVHRHAKACNLLHVENKQP